jgi:hypothetical protein
VLNITIEHVKLRRINAHWLYADLVLPGLSLYLQNLSEVTVLPDPGTFSE